MNQSHNKMTPPPPSYSDDTGSCKFTPYNEMTPTHPVLHDVQWMLIKQYTLLVMDEEYFVFCDYDANWIILQSC